MTTFKAEVSKREKRKDGTYNVKIRITHKRVVRRYATQMYATDSEITRSGKIKNQIILDNTDGIIKEWRRKLLSLGEQAEQMNVNDVVRFLTSTKEEENIPMFPWMLRYAEKIKKPTTRYNYIQSIRTFEKWVGYDIYFTQLKSAMLREFLEKHGANGHRILLNIRKMFREARLEYNEDDRVRIPDDPFARVKIAVKPRQRKRSITVDAIRMVAEIPDEYHCHSTRNYARDMFLLSFCLMGTNFVDIYTASAPKHGVLTYRRSKTKDQRADEALISINIHPIAQRIIDKYKDDTSLTNLHRRFANYRSANACIQVGIRKIKEYLCEQYHDIYPHAIDEEVLRELGFKDFTFYSARHSWATIAYNNLRIDKWTVHEGMNHTDTVTAITDIYLVKDFTRINEANFKVIDYVLGDTFAKLAK